MHFIKKALEEKKKSWLPQSLDGIAGKVKSWAPQSLAGIAAGAATYGQLRRGKVRGAFMKNTRKHGLGHVVDAKAPKTRLARAADRVMYGGDKIYYTGGKAPKKPVKAKESLVFQQDYGPDYVRSKHEKGIGAIGDSKRKEMKVIEKLGPNATEKNVFTSTKHKGKSGLRKLHDSMGDKNYFIKPDQGYNSGVGGSGFLNKKDVEKLLAGKKLNRQKTDLAKEFTKNPSEFLAQKDMNLAKDKITKAPKEFRIHASGNQVVSGASSVRSKNLFGKPGEKRKAEKFLQKHLDNLPSKYRDQMIAADVGKTKDGKFKIIELNMGSNASGFLDPKYMKKQHGFIAGVEAARKNQAVYKNLTGRATKLEAGVKGLVVGPGAAAAANKIQEKRQSNS